MVLLPTLTITLTNLLVFLFKFEKLGVRLIMSQSVGNPDLDPQVF